MDQFSAHLDRGWDLVQRGDPQGAEQSARRALEIDNQSPEAFNLLGYVAALQGDFEEAVEHYRQAIALDDTYLEAMLNAAEVCIHPMGEFDDALAMCEQALDLAENDDETVDALLLCFDAHLGKGDLEAAKDVCRRFPKGPFENASHTFLVGRAFFEIGEIGPAAELIESAIQANGGNPDAYYYLGLIRDERGDVAGATEAFLRARDLDLEFPTAPWSLSRDTFRVSVDRAVQALAPEHRAYLRPGEVYVADVPGVEAVVDGVDPRTAVLIDALQGEGGAQASARLFVYQNNVERLAGGITGVEREITAAIEREVIALFIERSPSQPPASAARHSRPPPTSH
jgi:tetratricopeptide (TPR) repeat protein